MPYAYNMDKENQPDAILPEGWREFKCIDMVPEVSKKGNEMFVCEFMDILSGKSKKVWLVSTEGKRWMLKGLLSACGIERAADGNFNWDFPDIINKPIFGYVQNENETFIGRDGNEVTKPKSKIVEFKKWAGETAIEKPVGIPKPDAIRPEDVKWEE